MLWDMFCQMISKQWFELTCSWLINLYSWAQIHIELTLESRTKDSEKGIWFEKQDSFNWKWSAFNYPHSQIAEHPLVIRAQQQLCWLWFSRFRFQLVQLACGDAAAGKTHIPSAGLSGGYPPDRRKKKTGGRRKKRKYGFCLRQVLLRVMRLTLTRLALSSWSSCFAFSHLVLIALTVQDQSSSLNTWCPAFITRSAKLC